MGKRIGIWMDSNEAIIINAETEGIYRIESNVEHYNLHGGSGGNSPYAAQDATSETKLLDRKKHQMKDYFDNVIDQLDGVDHFVVFGPAEAKTAFKKEVEGNSLLNAKLSGIETSDKLTDNQLVQWVKNYFAI